MHYLIIIFLISLSGIFSGLTLGLLSLDSNELKRKASLGNKNAQKIYPIRKKGNLLLCTLLLGNVAVNSALAIFLGDITNGIVAGLLATGLIVLFGEILPQATFSRHAMKFGAKLVWLVKIFMFILYPFCWPIAWGLDHILGEEMQTIYSKKELMKIVEEHEDSEHSDVDADEERIIKGALSYSDKKVEQVMTPRKSVYCLEANSALTKKLLNEIKEQGYARIPIYEKSLSNTVGILYAKDLINIKPLIKIKDIYRKEKVLIVDPKIKLDKLLTMFIKSKAHMAFVKNEYKGLEGVATLEDVIEEIIKQEIIDETD